jgi:hypothetical protein
MRRLFDQIVSRPLAALFSSIEMLDQSLDGGQRVDGMVSRIIHTLSRPTGGVKDLSEPDRTQSSVQLLDDPTPVITKDAQEAAENDIQEKLKQGHDTNLKDDMLKLVRYQILFVKRDYEMVFPEKEELVPDNLNETVYTAWKIAEFIQCLDQTKIPQSWSEKNYPLNEDDAGPEGMIHSLPEEDKKYLRVFYEVLDRYPRKAASYKKRQLSALKGIRNAIGKLHR